MTEPVVLTVRQKDVFDFVQAYVDKQGYAPSIREIGDALGMHSSSTVHSHLKKLARLGLLNRTNQARAIRLNSSPIELTLWAVLDQNRVLGEKNEALKRQLENVLRLTGQTLRKTAVGRGLIQELCEQGVYGAKGWLDCDP